MSDYKNRLSNDFNNIEEIINNPNDLNRVHYSWFLNGNYGEEIYLKYLNRWNEATTPKKMRSFVIESFCSFVSHDANCTYQQTQRWLVKNIGIDNLEILNEVLIQDVKETYEGLGD